MPYERSTILHVTHWKAGSQWIKKILTEIAPERIAHMGERPKGDAAIGFKPGHIYPALYLTREAIKSMGCPADCRRFVVIRDLRDTLVSGYFSMRYSHPVIDDALESLRVRLNSMSLEDGLMMMMNEWLPSSARIQQSWIASGEYIVRYEDILSNTFEVLEEALLGRCGIDASSSKLREVVASNRFEAVTGGRQPGQEDLNAHERKGISGDWINYFTPALAKRFNHLYGDLLEHSLRLGLSPRKKSVVGEEVHAEVLTLDGSEVLSGYDEVCELNPYVPPLSHWRAWECAAYRKFELSGRVLDLGCGDGRYFRLNWPNVSNVVGVDKDPGVADAGMRSGAYREVHVVCAHEIPELSETFDHIFASCSLMRMNHLEAVLAEAERCLKPGGSLVCSVVTDRFHHWNVLPDLVQTAGFEAAAAGLRDEFFDFHHLVNPLSVDDWQRYFRNAGLIPEIYIPILPKFNSGFFLLMDCLWHVRKSTGGELGDTIYPFLLENPRFPQVFRGIIAGLLEMETDWIDCSGAVFLIRKPLQANE